MTVYTPHTTNYLPLIDVYKLIDWSWIVLKVTHITGVDSLQSKIEKVPRGIRGEKSSKDMESSRNLVSTIGALASPKWGRNQVAKAIKPNFRELCSKIPMHKHKIYIPKQKLLICNSP